MKDVYLHNNFGKIVKKNVIVYIQIDIQVIKIKFLQMVELGAQ